MFFPPLPCPPRLTSFTRYLEGDVEGGVPALQTSITPYVGTVDGRAVQVGGERGSVGSR